MFEGLTKFNLPGLDWGFIAAACAIVVPLVNALKKWFGLEGKQNLIAGGAVSVAVVFGQKFGIWSALMKTETFGLLLSTIFIWAYATGMWETVKLFIHKVRGE